MKAGLIWIPLLTCAMCFGQDTGGAAPAQSPVAPAGVPATQQAPGAGQQGVFPGQLPGQLPGLLPGAMNPNGADNRTLGNQNNISSDDQDNAQERLRPRPALGKTEFQIFAEEAVGHPFAVYGRSLFDYSLASFFPLAHVPVPADYVIGPGDEILVRVWGKIDMTQSVVVDRNGQISLPKVGTITVTGLRYDALQDFLHDQISKLYKDFDLNVTMGKLRTIQIYVLGNALQPGSYTLSSLSTLMDALFASGGPAANGSMRHIELRREGRTVTVFDVYDVQQKGDKSHDAQLLPGDVIYIPTIGPQVAIDGSVKAPGIYELKENETLGTLLEGAGGLTELASTDKVILEGIQDRRRRTVESFAFNDDARQRPLHDGDLLRISPILPKFVGEVTLRGNVSSPGRVPWREGMRISDLIPSREALVTRDHWEQHNHLADQQNLGVAANTIAAQTVQSALAQSNVAAAQNSSGSVQAASASTPGGAATVQTGTATAPGALNAPAYVRPTIDILDDLNRTNTEINWDYAVIERTDRVDLKTHLIPFNLANAIDHHDSTDNQRLESGDVVIILSKDDVTLPLEKQTIFVRINGEVGIPGVYRMKPGETLRDAIRRAGGLTQHSYLFGSQLNRVSTRRIQEQELALSIQRMRTELTYATLNSVPGALAASNSAASATNLVASQQMQSGVEQGLLQQLASVRPTGRVVLGIDPKASQIDELPDIPLEDGDDIIIPRVIGTIQVSGEVYNPSSLRYRESRRLRQYLNDAGGPTRVADEKRVFLIRADGTVVSKQSHRRYGSRGFNGLELMPGDAIVVPPQIKARGQFWAGLPALTSILSQTAMMASVISLVSSK